MTSTSVSLLQRLREPAMERAWGRFVELYAPLIYHWAQSQGLCQTDAMDLVQEVLTVLVVKLKEFEYDPNRRFRGWLRTITVNRARDWQRRKKPNLQLSGTVLDTAVESPGAVFEETEYRNFLVNRALKVMQGEFREETWLACWKLVAEGEKAADVAQELGMTVNAVYLAKSRVLKRLREELDGLLD